MSEDSNPKNVASVWILVVLVGGLSVPFWRWDDTNKKREEPLQWVEPGVSQDATANAPKSLTQHSLVSATSNGQSEQASELLHEFVNSDPGLQIQDAVKENAQRPGIPKQFQGEGIPLTDIKPWLPKPMGYDATPSEKQKLAGTVESPIPAAGAMGSGGADNLAQSASGKNAWPDTGYNSGNTPIAPPTMYYNAQPNAANVANNTPAQTPATPVQNSPGRMVSSSHSASDPPALMEAFPASPGVTVSSQSSNAGAGASGSGTQVKVTPSPAITPPANPLRGGAPAAAPVRRPGTVISQPKGA